MSNQAFGIDLVRSDGVEQHRYGDGIDQPCGDGNVAVPQAFEVKCHLLSLHPDIGDVAAGAIIFSHISKVAGIPTASIAVSTPRLPVIFMTVSTALPSLLLTLRGGAKALRHFKAIVVEVDHDDLGRSRRIPQ